MGVEQGDVAWLPVISTGGGDEGRETLLPPLNEIDPDIWASEGPHPPLPLSLCNYAT